MTSIYAFGTFSEGDASAWPGIVCDGKVAPLHALLQGAPSDLLGLLRSWEHWEEKVDTAVRSATLENWREESSFVARLPHLPDNLFGAGANYRKHVIDLIVDSGAGGVAHLSKEDRLAFGIREMDARAASGKPFVWSGLRSSIAGQDALLVLPQDVREPDWEFELAVVIGRRARRIPAGEGLDYVAGYTMANDITARELVSRSDLKNLGMDWMASKGSPGFKVIGPYITPRRFVDDPQRLRIKLSLGDRIMQDEGTDDMIFSAAQIVEFVSRHVELQPGDIIMTGSPSGNGTHYNRYLQEGDVMTGEIEGLVGKQVVRCVAEASGTAARMSA